MEFTTSQLACFKACPKKWFYRFVKLLDPVGHKRNLELGSYVHHLLDSFYNPAGNGSAILVTGTHGDSLQVLAEIRYTCMMEASEAYFAEKTKDLFELEVAQFVEMREEAEAIVTRYIEINADDLSKYCVLATEKEFAIPIYNPNGKRTRDKFMGKFDMIVKDEFDTIWFFEHKTTADSVDNRFETVELEEQLNNYTLVASTMYEDYGGGILNVIRKKAPRKPEPLKSGKGLSVAKNIDTTYEMYMEAIIEHKFNPADYTEILGILREKGDRFFGRKIISRKQHQLLETRNEIFYTVQAIKNMLKLYKKTGDEAVFYRTPNFMCKNCQYCNLCILDSKKGDTSSYIAGNFMIRETMNPELSMQEPDGIEQKR
jgi:hypothetical protein